MTTNVSNGESEIEKAMMATLKNLETPTVRFYLLLVLFFLKIYKKFIKL